MVFTKKADGADNGAAPADGKKKGKRGRPAGGLKADFSSHEVVAVRGNKLISGAASEGELAEKLSLLSPKKLSGVVVFNNTGKKVASGVTFS